MEIRSVDSIRGIDNNSKVNKVSRKTDEVKDFNDKAEISLEAKQKLEEAKINSILKNTSDIREDKVKEVKEKLQNGEYDREEVINVVAERIMKALGL
jgi:anti-sigma28 factor (negative regulator of flagellin synthesis)